ncbi:hypothetical protein ASNO1_73980 [Corallococcus caeni]|uniref:Uncharacterized protein n=1 Tax=Corallococcus caeni TaxID=3082388 RepID=A0ABQ6R5G9_9BACT|nr:hypothetical protein ASNO1_73980 [Corallococcus sp. NO1]
MKTVTSSPVGGGSATREAVQALSNIRNGTGSRRMRRNVSPGAPSTQAPAASRALTRQPLPPARQVPD